jgi:pectate lyase
MTGQIWTNRLVAAMTGLLVAASALFAAAGSTATPWSEGAQALSQGAPAGSEMRTAHAALTRASSARFGDDFERDPVGANPPAGWTVEDGLWDGVVNDGGKTVRHANGASYGHLVAGSASWTDYRVSARLRPTPLSTGFAGVAARYRDRGDYYACGVYFASAVRLWRVRLGAVTLLDARRTDVATNRFHDIRLVVERSHVSCVFDDVIVLEATDDSFASGRIALVAGSDEAAEFDDVVVAT